MVKLDIVSGFLGAGKTTFIKKILNTCAIAGEKVVLIENEFGDVGIDNEVLRVAGFDIYEISRGCVCCTLKEEFIFTLEQILSQKPDRIVFEPSGIFILSEIFDLFKSPEISETCCLNSVTTIVDGLNFIRHKDGFTFFFQNQIAKASSLVISKTQFLADKELDKIRNKLRKMNDSAEIISINWDDFSPEKIALLLDGNTKYAVNNLWGSTEGCTHKHNLNHFFESLGLSSLKSMDIKELEGILRQLSNYEFGKILRGKGIIKSGNKCFEFSYVEGKYSISETNSCLSGIASFIGRSIQRDKLIAAFEHK